VGRTDAKAPQRPAEIVEMIGKGLRGGLEMAAGRLAISASGNAMYVPSITFREAPSMASSGRRSAREGGEQDLPLAGNVRECGDSSPRRAVVQALNNNGRWRE
jgi:hypothetical protein